MIKIAVKIQLKKEVLDTRGRSILKRLQKKSPLIKECRYGKYIELAIEETDAEKALSLARVMAQDILSHDLIESFDLEVL